MIRRLKHRLYVILEGGKTTDLPSRIFDAGIVLLILANVVAFILESVPAIEARHGQFFAIFDTVSVAIFSLEYLLRLWVCTEHPPLRSHGPWEARVRFAATPFMVIDLLVILPYYIALILPVDLRVLRVFRLLRYLRFVRMSPALSTLWMVVVTERRALAGTAIVMMGLLLLAASALYLIEGEVQPKAFGTMPDAMWWAVATLTTVGYGDVVPVSALGKLVGGVVMMMGLAMFALPVGIIATGFSQQIHRRDFNVEWGLIARVPLFADLDSAALARLMTLVRTRVVNEGEVIFRAGEEADAVYFVALGKVDLAEKGGTERVLGIGDVFGERAALGQGFYMGTARAKCQCHLVVIDAADFRALTDHNPLIAERLQEPE